MSNDIDFDDLFDRFWEQERKQERRRKSSWRTWFTWLRRRHMVRRVLTEFANAVYGENSTGGGQKRVALDGWPVGS
jgi:hypothetical protein